MAGLHADVSQEAFFLSKGTEWHPVRAWWMWFTHASWTKKERLTGTLTFSPAVKITVLPKAQRSHRLVKCANWLKIVDQLEATDQINKFILFGFMRKWKFQHVLVCLQGTHRTCTCNPLQQKFYFIIRAYREEKQMSILLLLNQHVLAPKA